MNKYIEMIENYTGEKHFDLFVGLLIALPASFIVFMINAIGRYFTLGMILGEVFKEVGLMQMLDYGYITNSNGMFTINSAMSIVMIVSLTLFGHNDIMLIICDASAYCIL